MGIDPGSRVTGYGLIELLDKTRYRYLDAGCLKMDSKIDFHQRLKQIYDHTTSLIEKFDPSEVAFEDVFVSKNLMSGLKLGQARAAAVLAAMNLSKEIEIYAAKEVKQAVTGYGNASKEQVQHSIIRLLNLSVQPASFDVSDALAIAICHAQRMNTKRKFEKLS